MGALRLFLLNLFSVSVIAFAPSSSTIDLVLHHPKMAYSISNCPRRLGVPVATCLGGFRNRSSNNSIINKRSVALASSFDDSPVGDFFQDDTDSSDDFGGGDPLFRRRGELDPTNKMTDDELDSVSKFDDHIPKLNTVTLSGRIGNDPDPKYFDDGKVVLNLSLAVKRKYHPMERKARNIKSGEEETDWFPLEIWGRDAEYATKYVTKGARVGITGSLVIDSWIDRNTGEKRRKPKIVVRHLDILETRAEAELRQGNKGKSYSQGGGGRSFYNRQDDYDEDGGPSPAGTGGFFD